MKRSFVKKLSLIACAILLAGLISACAQSGYTVTFVTDGGTEYAPVTTVSQEQAILLPTPERGGFVFTGWFTEPDCAGEALRGTRFVPTENTTLYAGWTACEYVVGFATDGGTEYDDVLTDGRAILLPTPQKDGYEFGGWFDNEACAGTALGAEYVPTSSVTLYARWLAVDYFTVTLDANGGTACAPLKSRGEAVTLPTPSRYGYEFAGWYATEGFTGTALGATLTPDSDVTLYAQWREVKYLYVYREETTEHVRFTFAPHETVELSTLEGVNEWTWRGVTCELLRFEDTNGNAIDEVTMNDHTEIIARYDLTGVPAAEYLVTRPDGSYETTGKVVKVLYTADGYPEAFSINASFYKGSSGGITLVFRASLSGKDYAWEDNGTSYMIAVIGPKTGVIETAYVKNNLWTLVSRVNLADAPVAWQKKYASAMAGEWMSVKLAVYDYGDSFDVFLDDDYVTSVSHSILSEMTGKGFGFRSNVVGSVWYGEQHATDVYNVSYEENGGMEVADGKWALGALDLPDTFRKDHVLEGWYTDSGFATRVDPAVFTTDKDVTLYANWVSADYNVTLMDGEDEVACYGYAGGEMYLPKLVAQPNRIFTGWYTDAACRTAFDPTEFVITEDLTLYAGRRLPTSTNYTYHGDSTWTSGVTNNALVVGETPYAYTEYAATVRLTVGVTKDSTSLAFRMSQSHDNYMEGTYLTWGLNNVTGALSFANSYQDRWNGAGVSIAIAFASTPDAWQSFWTEKITNGKSGDVVSLKLSVRDYGSYVACYVNDLYVYTYSTAAKLDLFTDTGYGMRISGDGVNFTMHAPVELNAPVVTFCDGEDELGTAIFAEDAFAFPSFTKINRVTNAWYYDKALTQPIDKDTFAPSTDTRIYAGWRFFTNSSYVEQPDGSYTIGTTNGAMVFGETPYRYTEHAVTARVVVGVTKESTSLAFRMRQTRDNAMEGTYLAWGLNNGTGAIGFYNSYQDKYNGAGFSISTALASTPDAWQSFWTSNVTNGKTGDVVWVKLSVRDYGSFVECYANDTLIYTYSDVSKLTLFTDVGYGMRISADDVNFTMHEPVELNAPSVTFRDGDTVLGTGAYVAEKFSLPAYTKTNRTVSGWYYDEALTEPVNASTFAPTADVTLYAKWRFFTNSSYVEQTDGSYTIGTTDGAMIFGETPYRYTEYSATFRYTVGVTKNSMSLAFRMSQTRDDYMEGTYLAWGVTNTSGALWFGTSYKNKWNNAEAGISVTVKLASAPAAWQTFWAERITNGTSGSTVDITLTVRDYGTYVECYVEGILAYTFDNVEKLNLYSDVGYGTRISADNVNVMMHAPKELTLPGAKANEEVA